MRRRGTSADYKALDCAVACRRRARDRSRPNWPRTIRARLRPGSTVRAHSRPDGRSVAAAWPSFNGTNKPHRADRRWVNAWSPEQIAQRLKFDFPDDDSMRISHEAIYQALYVQGRGALKRELVACLRTGPALGCPSPIPAAGAHVTPEVLISERPAEVEDRAVPGHWEGDLSSAWSAPPSAPWSSGRPASRCWSHLPREGGLSYLQGEPKNGPALAGYGAITMKDALAATMTTLPEHVATIADLGSGQGALGACCVQSRNRHRGLLRRSAQSVARGSNENTGGLLRQYFPKGTDLSRWSAKDLDCRRSNAQ